MPRQLKVDKIFSDMQGLKLLPPIHSFLGATGGCASPKQGHKPRNIQGSQQTKYRKETNRTEMMKETDCHGQNTGAQVPQI